MIKFPGETKNWIPDTNTDLLGDLVETKNLNLDHRGYIELSASPRCSMDNATDTDFDLAMGIVYSEDYGFFIVTSDDCFQLSTDLLGVRPTQIGTAGVPSGDQESDVTWFGGLMVVSQDTDVDYYDPAANTWTDTNISLTSALSAGHGQVTQHQVVNFVSLQALAVVNVNTIKLYASPLTATPTLITTLTIPADFVITSVKYFNQNLYIGTANVYGGRAYMYVWNGQGTAAQQAHLIDSHTIVSLEPHEGTVFLVSTSGALLKFTGSGFVVADAWPMYYVQQNPLVDGLGNSLMFKNVMISNGQNLYIVFAAGGNNDQALPNQPDGVYCYDSALKKMYHRYSLTHALVTYENVGDSAVDVSTDQITVSNNHITGTEVVFDSAFALAPLVQYSKYFTIRVDATHIKLATTLANALAGTAIDLTSVAAGTYKLVFFPDSDYGVFFASGGTAISLIPYPTDRRIYGVDVIYGGEADTRTLTGSDDILNIPSDGVEARGGFTTRKIFSTNVTDNNNQITLKFSKLMSELDRIIIKYRNTDDRLDVINNNNSSWGITWTSSTTFTTTVTNWADAVVGDEVNVLSGAAGGLLAHIVTIVNNAGTYTVTIDETFRQYTSGDVAIAVFRNWKKWKTISYGDTNATKGYLVGQLGKAGKFLQLKVELRGIKTRIEELMVDNDYHLPATN